ncbi:ribonuclease P protein component [Thermodesulfobium fumaratoxidans]
MLSKDKSLSNSLEIRSVLNSKRRDGLYFNVFYRPSQSFRICVIVSKKVSKSSVKRNYMKRLVKSFCVKEFFCNKNRKDFFDIVILVRKSFTKANRREVIQELINLCKYI